MRITENLEILWKGIRTNFPRIWLGHDEDHLVYYFFQPRQGDDEYWGGIGQTFKRPPAGIPVAFGYGYYPGRAWLQQFLLEAGGELAGREVWAKRVILWEPKYRRMDVPHDEFVAPDEWRDGIPYREGKRLGGIHFLGTAPEAWIERADDGDIAFVAKGKRITLSEIAGLLGR